MNRLSLIIFFGFLASTLQQKDPDEGKPYEFGFTIDGQQHRHEKKDIRGIIEGEFGFITADGIYHVTVYATDENGNFKILSMKNIRISAPLDGSPFKGEISPEANKYRKQANLPSLPPSPQPSPNPLAIPEPSTPSAVATTSREPVKFTTQPTIKPACAGCGYVTTQKPQPGQPLLQFTKPTFVQDQNVKPPQPFGMQNGQSSPTYYENAGGITGTPSAGNYNHGNSQQLGSGFPQNIPSEQTGGGPDGGFVPQNGQDSQNYIGGLTSSDQYENTAGVTELQNTGQPQNNLQQGAAPSYGTDQGGIGGGLVSQLAPGSQGRPQISSGGLPQYQATSGPQNTDYKPSRGQPSSAASYGGSEGTQNTQNYGGTSGDNVGSGNLGGSAPGAGGGGGVVSAGYGGQTSIGGGTNHQPQGIGSQEQSGAPNFEQLGFPQPNPLQINEQRPGAHQVSNLPPISVSNGVIHVGGDQKQDIPIKDKFPGMQEGLPEGIEEKDITNLLYKFHYTVGFHGHYEKGLKNGAKIGGYFVNGRDGISRVVTYIADENGYRPKVRFINIGLESEDTPKPESEKKFGLKSFEFVWYPI